MAPFDRHTVSSKKLFSLAFFLSILFLIGFSGSLFKPDAWFMALTKPMLMPPSYVFPIAWTFLYILIAIAGWLVWIAPSSTHRTRGLLWYTLQLFFNSIWTYLFFGMHRPDLALLDMSLLILSLCFCMRYVRRVSPWGFILLIPYIAWLCFAFYLNFSIWRMNH